MKMGELYTRLEQNEEDLDGLRKLTNNLEEQRETAHAMQTQAAEAAALDKATAVNIAQVAVS